MTSRIIINEFHSSSDFTTSYDVHPTGDPNFAFDGNTYTSFKPDVTGNTVIIEVTNTPSVVIDTLSISGLVNYPQDFNYITLYGDNDSAFSTEVVIARLYKTDIDAGVMTAFSDNLLAFTNFRLRLVNIDSSMNEFEIGNIILGRYIDISNGIAAPYTPPKLSAKTEILNNKTMGGHFVGRSVLSGQYDFIIKNKNVSPEWIEENWLDLHKQISEKPFMYLWDDSRPQDAVFCWTKGDIPPPRYDNQCYFSFSIPCNGFIENE